MLVSALSRGAGGAGCGCLQYRQRAGLGAKPGVAPACPDAAARPRRPGAECRADARGAFVVLTDAGRAAIERAAPADVETGRELVFDWTQPQPQLAALTAITSGVLDRLGASPQPAVLRPAPGRRPRHQWSSCGGSVRSSGSSSRSSRMRRLESGRWPGVPPAEQFLALGVDDRLASVQGGLIFRGSHGRGVLVRFQPVEQLTETPGPVLKAGSQRGPGPVLRCRRRRRSYSRRARPAWTRRRGPACVPRPRRPGQRVRPARARRART